MCTKASLSSWFLPQMHLLQKVRGQLLKNPLGSWSSLLGVIAGVIVSDRVSPLVGLAPLALISC